MKKTLRLCLLSLAAGGLHGCHGCDDDSNAPPPPAAPSGIGVNAPSSGRIDITWTDNSGNEVGFRIECSPDGVTFTEVGTTAADATLFTHRGLTPNTPYWYQVRAFNAGGNSAYDGPATTSTQNVAWTSLAAGPERTEHTAVYDSVGQRMIVYGGYDSFLTVYNQVWELTLGATPTWNQLSPTGATAPNRASHTAILDTANQRIIVFGGGDGFLIPQNDVWELSLTATPNWTAVSPTGGPPTARLGHTAIYDAGNQRMIVFGGNAGGAPLNDVWELSLPTAGTPAWNQLSPVGMLARDDHSAVYDPLNQRMLVFAGLDGSGSQNEVWELTLPAAGNPTWTQLGTTGLPPSARSGSAMVFDLTDERAAFFSGLVGLPPLDQEAWVLNPLLAPAWTLTAPGGAGTPPGRWGNIAVYDSANHRMVIHGGDDGSFFTSMMDTWALDF